MTILNLLNTSTNAPELIFGANLRPDGTVDDGITVDDNPSVPTIKKEVSPNAPDGCEFSYMLSGVGVDGILSSIGGPIIPADSASTFTVVVGPVADPLPSGLRLLIRAFPGPVDSNAEFLDWSIPAFARP